MANVFLTCKPEAMKAIILVTNIYILVSLLSLGSTTKPTNDLVKPSVMVAVLIRNKAHSLPYFFGYLEHLNYPKDRISFWIRSDHNEDDSSAILKEWAKGAEKVYHSINLRVSDDESGYEGVGPLSWPIERFQWIMRLKQKALRAARKAWADYILFVDADVLLENANTLTLLMDQGRTIVAPMLNSSSATSTYSNFWGGMHPNGYYKRVPEYFPIVYRQTVGCFHVPLVHSAVLINLRHKVSRRLAFYPPPPDYTGPTDDIIQFAITSNSSGVSMHVLNKDYFGRMANPLSEKDTLFVEREHFLHVKTEAMVEGAELQVSKYISLPPVHKDKLGFDEAYLINLERRPERRRRMLATLDELGIAVKLVDAVDGRKLNDSYLEQHGIAMLPDYADPYWNRRLTNGEIGCFMSHYNIWLEVLEKNYDRVLVMEDDVRFDVLFRTKLNEAISDADRVVPDWDLIYVGRKILIESEKFVEEGKTNLVYPGYSYWTLGYVLTNRGARKLVDAKPLGKMVPVDEYLPIMFDRHNRNDWSSHFPNRNLVTLSVNPLVISPTHYVGDPKYFSDTEASKLVPETAIKSPKGPERIPLSEQTQRHDDL